MNQTNKRTRYKKWKNLPCARNVRIHVIKSVYIIRTICRFNLICPKISVFLISRKKQFPIVKAVLIENKVGGIIAPYLRTYCRAVNAV